MTDRTIQPSALPSECAHVLLKPDAFSRLPGVRRSVPGDVLCAKCGEPLPLWWNSGKPEPADA